MSTFTRYVLYDIETDIDTMKAKGIWSGCVPQVFNALLTRINRRDAVKIGNKMEPRGATIHLSQDRIGDMAGITAKRRRSIVNDCVQKIVDAGILAKERGGPGSHGSLKYIFLSQVRANQEALARLVEAPDQSGRALEEQVESSKSRVIREECPDTDQSALNEGVRENQKGVRFENNSCTPLSVHSPEYYLETSRIPSSTSLVASTGIAFPTLTEKEGEEAESKTQPAYPVPEPDPPPPAPACSQNGTEKPKTSQKEENADFFLRESFRLADKFAGDEIEFEDDNQRRQRTYQFRNLLIKEFHSTSAATRYPDPDLRFRACAEVVRIWIDIVKSRNNPAQYIGFISTEPGMRALTQARKQIFRSTDDYQQIELDPTLQALWKAKYGDNWREKRRQELSHSTARAA